MLTEVEKTYATELLKALGLSELSELAKTCTNGVINPSNTNDAINAILLHTEDVKSLLMRKKITRNILFKYLHSKNISFPGNTEKLYLVELVINFWQKNDLTVSNICSEPTSPDATLQSLALKFSEWYYDRLNSTIIQQKNNTNTTETLTVDDFWRDAKLQIKLTQNSGDINEYCAEGANECLLLIRQMCIGHSLIFSPNLSSEGTKGVCEPHGVVLIMNCGTLHSAEGKHCVGIYEQIFGLIKDPTTEHNWKIKLSKLILRSQQVFGIPSLSTGNQFVEGF